MLTHRLSPLGPSGNALIAICIASLAFPPRLSAQPAVTLTRIADVLRYSGIDHPQPDDVARLAALWARAQQAGLATSDRQLVFRDMFVRYARLQGRDVTDRPQVLDGTARFATSIVEGGGRMDLTLPEPRGNPSGRYLHVETRGRGRTPLLLISDIGVDGRKLYDSFARRGGREYAMHIVTLPYAGAARPLPWPEKLEYTERPWLGQIERELVALVDQPRMRGVTVIGTSAGGYFAARLALLRPTRIRAAVLVNALVNTPIPGPPTASKSDALAQRLSLVKSIPPAPQLFPVAPIPAAEELRRLIADSASTHPSVQNWMAFAVKDTALSRAWTYEALSGGFFLPANRYRWELTTTDLTELLERLSVPTLAIGSRHDPASPTKTFPAVSQWEELKLLHPKIPLTVLTLDGTRHYVSADAPEAFDRALADFLRTDAPQRRLVFSP